MNKTYAILGFGNRGGVYAEKLKNQNQSVVAICDVQEFKRKRVQEEFVGAEFFTDENEFFKKKRADVLVIATMDKLHYLQTLKAIDLGYDIVLEKPIATTYEECVEVARRADEKGVTILICHVLRYTAFYSQIKDLLDNGVIGNVVSAEFAENVNLGHYMMSFVRGNWNNAEKSTPIIVQKCSHDFDLIYWFLGSKCSYVSSFGNLSYFNREHEPGIAADYCYECENPDCIFNVYKLYKRHPEWLYSSDNDIEKTPEGIERYLHKKINRNKCVFRSDNDVMDHQIVNMSFENGATAQLSMTAFNQDGGRTIKLHGTLGTIEGKLEDGKIYVRLYDNKFQSKDFDKIIDTGLGHYTSHSGGDDNIVASIIDYFGGNKCKRVSDIKDALHSHIMAFKADESRINNGVSLKVE